MDLRGRGMWPSAIPLGQGPTGQMLQEGYLVHAAGEEKPHTLDVIRTPITIRCRALDLTGSPSEVLASVDRVAEVIAAKVSTHSL